MNICMHVLSPARTNIRAIRAAKALVDSGLPITLVDIEHAYELADEEGGSTKFAFMPQRQDIGNIRMKHILLPNSFARYYDPIHPLPWLLFKLLRIFCAMIAVIRIPADVYHASDLTALPACYVAACLRRKPLIFETYDMPLVLPQVTRMRLLHACATRLLRAMIPRCAAVISPSPPIAQKLQRLFKAQSELVIRNIPPYQQHFVSDRLRHHLELGPQIQIALYQGDLRYDRGLDILVRAAHYLEPNIVIVLMGKGESQASLEALIAREGVGHRVKLLPVVPYSELLTWTASADLGLIIYQAHSPNVPMMLPNKLFEYLMAGVPVLTSPLEAVVEIVNSYQVGRVVSSLDPREVGQTINTMLADRAELARFRVNALAASERELCWEVESQRLIQIYQDILGSRFYDSQESFSLNTAPVVLHDKA